MKQVLDRQEILGALFRHGRRTLIHPTFRRSAVLVPLVEIDGEWQLVFTRRAEHLPHHKGQVSFPGGGLEETELPYAAALREAEEEIGLTSERVQFGGMIDDIWTPSGYIVTPVIGILDNADNLTPNPNEVARVFHAPLSFFADNKNAVEKEVRVNGFTRKVYYYYYDGETIWGATAFILRDLLRRMG